MLIRRPDAYSPGPPDAEEDVDPSYDPSAFLYGLSSARQASRPPPSDGTANSRIHSDLQVRPLNGGAGGKYEKEGRVYFSWSGQEIDCSRVHSDLQGMWSRHGVTGSRDRLAEVGRGEGRG